MALELGTISTGVDGFIRLIRESGRVDINDAAVRMGMSRQVLEEWAQVLEEQGLIRIEYQLTKVYLIWIAATKEEVEAKKEAITDRKSATLRQAESQLEEIMKLGIQLDDMEDEFTQVSEAFEVRLGGIKSRIDVLHDMKRQREELRFGLQSLQNDYASKLKGIRDQVASRDKEISEALRKEESLIQKTKQMGIRLAEFRTSRDELSSLVAEAKKELGPGLEKISKQADSVIKAVDASEIDYVDLMKKLKAVSSFAKEGKSDILLLSKELASKSEELEEIKLGQELLEVRVKELGLKLAEMRTSRDLAMGAIEKARKEMAPGLALVTKQAESLSREFNARDGEYEVLVKKLRVTSAALKKGRDVVQELKGELDARSVDLAAAAKRQEAIRARLKELEPKVASFHSSGDELKDSTGKAKRGLADLNKVSKRAESIAKEVDLQEKEYGDMARRAVGIVKALKKNRDYLTEFEGEIDARVAQLEKMRAASSSDLEKISLEIDKEAKEASGYVTLFEERIGNMRSVNSRLEALATERKAITDALDTMIKELKGLDFVKSMISTDEMLRRVAVAKEKLAQFDERASRYGDRQREARSELKKIWETEGKGG